MNKRKLMKQILAGILAAMIGLSALGGLIMAFAATSEADEDMSYDIITSGTQYIPADEDWEYLSLETTDDVEVVLEDKATITVPEGVTDYLWLGWSYQYNSRITQLADKHMVNFDVVDFTFASSTAKVVTMTMTTRNPYLYRVTTGGDLVAVASEYKDGVHTFATDILDTFVASDSEIAL